MDKLRERIQLLISTKGMTNAVFAERIGVQPSNISHVLSGRNKPSLDLVNKILKSFKEIRTDWLLNGTGPMTKEYSLFEDDENKEEIQEMSTEEPIAENAASETVQKPARQELEDSQIDKKEEKRPQPEEKEEVKKDFEETSKTIRKIENKNPHKKTPKSIERIVIFYEDKTFSEYYPGD